MHRAMNNPSRVRMLLSAFCLTVTAPATTSALVDDENTAQGEPDGNRQAEPSASPAAPSFCEALATAAASNDLPVDFFTRLIWQESRFNPYAVSRAGAQGVAQFMPGTARLRAVEDPFNPTEAIAKLLSSSTTCVGNLEALALRQPPTMPALDGFATGWAGGAHFQAKREPMCSP